MDHEANINLVVTWITFLGQPYFALYCLMNGLSCHSAHMEEVVCIHYDHNHHHDLSTISEKIIEVSKTPVDGEGE